MWSSLWQNVKKMKFSLLFDLLCCFRCIEKWLRTTPKCPQCQTTAKRKDLRRIYCRALNVLDTSEHDIALRERDLEKRERKKLAYEKAELQLAYDMIKDQLKRLQTEHDRLL